VHNPPLLCFKFIVQDKIDEISKIYKFILNAYN